MGTAAEQNNQSQQQQAGGGEEQSNTEANLLREQELQQNETFRERKLRELNGEGNPGGQPNANDDVSDTQQDLLDLDDLDDEQASQLDSEADEEGQADEEAEIVDEEADEDDEPTGDDVDESEDTIESLREEVAKANEARDNMEKDYRQKTAKIAETARQMDGDIAEVNAAANFMIQVAKQDLNRFQNVDWDKLRTNPAEFEKAQKAYNTALGKYRQMTNAMQKVSEQGNTIRKQNLQRQAEISRNILETTIDGFNKEHYTKMRDFAVSELGYTVDDFAEVVDWRVLTLINDRMALTAAPQDIETINKKVKKKSNRKRNKSQQQRPRDGQGRFTSAQQNLRENPGDRGAKRSFFQEKLAAERAASQR